MNIVWSDKESKFQEKTSLYSMIEIEVKNEGNGSQKCKISESENEKRAWIVGSWVVVKFA